MRAIMVMFDSLRRDMLPPYGGTEVELPAFARLAEHTVVFDNNYVASLPCMPARRELHTGRYNFLHRGWSPVEPFDDSMPELLRQAGVHSHLCTDHYHYLQDGGATYQGRYSTWECFRGQETDRWKADLAPKEGLPPHLLGIERIPEGFRKFRLPGAFQNDANRACQHAKQNYPQARTFGAGLEFLRDNAGYDNWFLQIETFDPHEPFDAPEEVRRALFDPDRQMTADWPPYAKVTEDAETVRQMRRHYCALLKFCDENLGRVLDAMDRYDLWNDTMLIVNTDHGFMLGEHDWWGKSAMPDYNEMSNTPLFIWDPRSKKQGERRGALTQTIDLAPTLLDYFGVPIPPDMQGKVLADIVAGGGQVRDHALFGYFDGNLNITDGRYVYMRAVQDPDVPTYEYTLMPTEMDSRAAPQRMAQAQLAPAFGFTKGCPVLRIPAPAKWVQQMPAGESLLFDLSTDPGQNHPICDSAVERRLLAAMGRLMAENEAPEEVYRRYRIPRPGDEGKRL